MVSSVLVPRRSRAKIWSVIILLVLLAVVGSVSYLGWRQSVRGVVSLTPPPRFVGARTALVFTLEAARGNVAHAEIRAVQGANSAVVAKQDGERGQARRAELRVGSARARGACRTDRPALGHDARRAARDYRGGRSRQRGLTGDPVGAPAASLPA